MGPSEKETAAERGPAADHRRLARRPVLIDPIQLIGPASPFGDSRETFRERDRWFESVFLQRRVNKLSVPLKTTTPVVRSSLEISGGMGFVAIPGGSPRS